MTHKPNGGPAFPQVNDPRNLPGGMSLRDFAAITLPSPDVTFASLEQMAAFMGETIPDDATDAWLLELGFRTLARIRYMVADAIISERNK